MNKRSMIKTLLAAALIGTATVFAAGGAAVKGNPKSKVYHLPACKHYEAKGSTVEFKSVAEAGQAGYKPCKICGKAEKTQSGSTKEAKKK